jgi:hypothetical protein
VINLKTKAPTPEQLLEDMLSDMPWKEIAQKYDYSDSRFLRKLAKRWDLPKRRKIFKPSKEELETLIYEQKLTPYDIAEKLGYAENGWSLIYKYCREYGIVVDNRPYVELKRTDFTDEQKSIIFGTLLGDGSLRNTYKNYALALGQGQKQLEYLNWKKEKLSNFIVKQEPKVYQSKSEHNHAPMYHYHTISHPFLTELRGKIYPNGDKTVTKEWLDNIDELAMAVWYMDDGSQNKRYGTISLCTNGFSYEEHLLMQNWFFTRWNIEVQIEHNKSTKTGKDQQRLRINTSEAKDFCEIVKPFIPDCMNYKVQYKYN